ncbi:NAD(P)-binding protein, partial [Pseudohyphozyma bogoriensis]
MSRTGSSQSGKLASITPIAAAVVPPVASSRTDTKLSFDVNILTPTLPPFRP